MNRREALSAALGLAAGTWLGPLIGRIEQPPRRDFDPFMVWRETARFDREVRDRVERRLAMAMFEKIDRSWGA